MGSLHMTEPIGSTVEPQLSEPTGRQTIRSYKLEVRIGEMEPRSAVTGYIRMVMHC